jgi:hypothetical protein
MSSKQCSRGWRSHPWLPAQAQGGGARVGAPRASLPCYAQFLSCHWYISPCRTSAKLPGPMRPRHPHARRQRRADSLQPKGLDSGQPPQKAVAFSLPPRTDRDPPSSIGRIHITDPHRPVASQPSMPLPARARVATPHGPHARLARAIAPPRGV